MGDRLADTGDLVIFVRIADAGTVTRAAAQMFISQPAVTQRLRKLERTLGNRLVERRGRRVTLTEAGQQSCPWPVRSSSCWNRYRMPCRRPKRCRGGEVVLGASATIGEFLLPKRLSAFSGMYPNITVRLHIDNTQGIVERVLDHTVCAHRW